MQQEYHIWELIPNAPYEFQVNFNANFKEKLAYSLPRNRYKTIRMLNNTLYAQKECIKANYSRWSNWFKYNDVNFPLWAAMGLCELAGISLIEMEQNITFYKQKMTPNRVCVKNPKLPLKFDPVFVSLSSHFCFDGSLPQNGRSTIYTQKNKIQLDNFIRKVKHCFGDTHYKVYLDRKSITNLKFPRFIGEICKHVCNFSSYGTLDGHIPTNLQNLSREYLLSILISAIIDEGSIQEYIQFGVCGKNLIRSVRNISIKLGYDCSKIVCRKRYAPHNNYYYFYIKSMDKLYRDYLETLCKYDLLSLAHKHESLKFASEAKHFYHGKSTKEAAELRKGAILDSLKGKSKTANEIAREVQIRPRSLRRLLLQLLKANRVARKRYKTSGIGYIYASA